MFKQCVVSDDFFGTARNPLRPKASPVVEQRQAGDGKVALLDSTPERKRRCF
jgi:hypothetical protein